MQSEYAVKSVTSVRPACRKWSIHVLERGNVMGCTIEGSILVALYAEFVKLSS